MFLQIVTPDGIIFENNEVEQLSVTTEDGYITILPEHTHLTTLVVPCELEFKVNNSEEQMAIGLGLLRVSENKVVLLVDTANTAESIDENTSEAARARAEELLNESDTLDEEILSKLQAELSREMARVNVVNFQRLKSRKGVI